MLSQNESDIIDFLKTQGEKSSREIFDGLVPTFSYATLKRVLKKLVAQNYIDPTGKGKATKYLISPGYELIRHFDIEQYYQKDIDDREIKKNFDFKITEILAKHAVFTDDELAKLQKLQLEHQSNTNGLSENEYKKEMERLAIDLSWKSSQIEGNTYSLLETEKLLKDKKTAAGKTKEEAVMLLNHKDALDFIIAHPGYLHPVSVSKIEDLHSILIKELAVERNLRKRRIGISGTNYRPLDNEFQLSEALAKTCDVINQKTNAFEKAFLALIMISYIQPFMDGNKRTARMVGNAILLHECHCPLSFRTVDSLDYKKAILLFYEQNNISAFKEIFIGQFEFAVKNYF